jgi:hypothetical protein
MVSTWRPTATRSKYQELGGFRDLVLTGFESGDINFTPEYAASMLEFLNDNAGEATSDVGETVDALTPQLRRRSTSPPSSPPKRSTPTRSSSPKRRQRPRT